MMTKRLSWAALSDEDWREPNAVLAGRLGISVNAVRQARVRHGHPVAKAEHVRFSTRLRKDASDRIDALQKRWATTKVATVERCIDEAYDREMKKEDS